MLNKILKEDGQVIIAQHGWDCSGDCGCGTVETYVPVCDSSPRDLALLIGRLINYRRQCNTEDVLQEMADALLDQIERVYPEKK